MKKITQKMVREWKKISKKAWHDEAWHAFMSSETSKAIEQAFETSDNFASVKDVTLSAREILEIMSWI
jgi:hypothetical protein